MAVAASEVQQPPARSNERQTLQPLAAGEPLQSRQSLRVVKGSQHPIDATDCVKDVLLIVRQFPTLSPNAHLVPRQPGLSQEPTTTGNQVIAIHEHSTHCHCRPPLQPRP